MKLYRLPTLAALIGACVFTAACDRRESTVPPPMPQTTTPSTTPSPGGAMPAPPTMPSDAASMPGSGASR